MVKDKLHNKLAPLGFVSLDDFHQRKIRMGESLSMYVHDSKKLLNQAMPSLNATAKIQLLLHQFLAGLPQALSHQLRAAGETTDLEMAIERTKLLLALEEQDTAHAIPAAAVAKCNDSIEQLKSQMMKLTEQVAALSTLSSRERRCFVCNRLGHLTIKSRLAVIPGKICNAVMEVVLDSGSSVSLVQQHVLSQAHGWTSTKTPQGMRLVTASGEDLPIVDYIRARIEIGELDLIHDFVVVKSLVAHVILVVDFLYNNALMLDFTTNPVSIRHTQGHDKHIDTSTVTCVYWCVMLFLSLFIHTTSTCTIALLTK